MNKELSVFSSIDIAAGPEQVWDALVNPETIKSYLFGTETITDWQPGSPIIFQGEYQGQAYRDKGTIVQCRANEILSYSYWSGFSGMEDLPENYALVEFHLKPADGHITLELKQTGFINEQAQQHSVAAWKQILEALKSLVEAS
ncbi:MAG TPA: SRPBCC domain-containing protein [Saprospiraceae bacterium]|nr:SRPBCC domain-containing protein [Saprospiraceae bacterium]